MQITAISSLLLLAKAVKATKIRQLAKSKAGKGERRRAFVGAGSGRPCAVLAVAIATLALTPPLLPSLSRFSGKSAKDGAANCPADFLDSRAASSLLDAEDNTPGRWTGSAT